MINKILEFLKDEEALCKEIYHDPYPDESVDELYGRYVESNLIRKSIERIVRNGE